MLLHSDNQSKSGYRLSLKNKWRCSLWDVRCRLCPLECGSWCSKEPHGQQNHKLRISEKAASPMARLKTNSGCVHKPDKRKFREAVIPGSGRVKVSNAKLCGVDGFWKKLERVWKRPGILHREKASNSSCIVCSQGDVVSKTNKPARRHTDLDSQF